MDGELQMHGCMCVLFAFFLFDGSLQAHCFLFRLAIQMKCHQNGIAFNSINHFFKKKRNNHAYDCDGDNKAIQLLWITISLLRITDVMI